MSYIFNLNGGIASLPSVLLVYAHVYKLYKKENALSWCEGWEMGVQLWYKINAEIAYFPLENIWPAT